MIPVRRFPVVLPSLVAFLALLCAPAWAGVHFHSPGIGLGVGFASGPIYPFAPYWSSPWYGDPFYGPFLGGPVFVGPTSGPTGEIKFKNSDPAAQVYVDGAYAGTAKELKNRIALAPGAYNVELRSKDNPIA